jgi:Family of unknown function (DUF6221)
MIDDLVTWLRAQLDDDERGVREWTKPREDLLLTTSLRDIHEWAERAGAKRVRDEIEAKRRIIDLHADDGPHECATIDRVVTPGEHYTDYRLECLTLRLLALPHVGRPGYCEEWRP